MSNEEARFDLAAVGSITLFDHMMPVPRLPGAGDAILLPVEAGRVYFGGCGLNQAMAAAALGASAAACMCVGEDLDSSGYRVALESAGVDLEGVTVITGENSGHSYMPFDPAGDSFLIVEEGASRRQSEIEPPLSVIRRARAVTLTMPFDSYCEALAREARAAGALVIASGQLMTSPVEVQRRVLASCTHLSCNEAELDALEEIHGISHPAEVFTTGAFAGAWITRGSAGVTVIGPDYEAGVPAVAAEAVVDPIGAGDAFTAGAALAVAGGADLVEAARVGAAVASFVVEKQGCQTNLPDWGRLAARFESAFGRRPDIAPVDRS